MYFGRKQLRLESIKEAVGLIVYPMDKEAFNQILIKNGVLSRTPTSK
jgi:hypothetical protein